MYDKIVIGIDQSYNNTGISVCADRKLRCITSVWLGNLQCNTQRRQMLSERLEKLLINITANDKSHDVRIILERIRLSSQGFTNIDYIKSIGALNACIVDVAKGYNINTYSVDTRSWKSQVIGSSKPEANSIGVDPEKWPTIQFLIKHGYEKQLLREVSKQKKKGVFVLNGKRYVYNDDAADSACIALYGFLPASKQKLEEEH